MYVNRPQRSNNHKDSPKNKKAKGSGGDYEHDTNSNVSLLCTRAGLCTNAVYMPSCLIFHSLLHLIHRRAAWLHPAHQSGIVPFQYNLMPTFGPG